MGTGMIDPIIKGAWYLKRLFKMEVERAGGVPTPRGHSPL